MKIQFLCSQNCDTIKTGLCRMMFAALVDWWCWAALQMLVEHKTLWVLGMPLFLPSSVVFKCSPHLKQPSEILEFFLPLVGFRAFSESKSKLGHLIKS